MSRREPATKLPPPWWYSVEDLATEWVVSTHRVHYYLDAGLIYPGALVPRWKLGDGAPPGPSPHVCVLLPGYRELIWSHTPTASTTALIGAYEAIAIDEQWPENFTLQLEHPVEVSRSDLVVLLEQKEHLEQVETLGHRTRLNPVERRNLLWLIGTLLQADKELSNKGSYTVGRALKTRLELAGHSLSVEAIAAKVTEARALVPSPTLERVA